MQPIVLVDQQLQLPHECRWATPSLTWCIYSLLEINPLDEPPPMWEHDEERWLFNCDHWLHRFNQQLLLFPKEQHIRGYSIALYQHPTRTWIEALSGKSRPCLDAALFYNGALIGCYDTSNTDDSEVLNQMIVCPYDPIPNLVRWKH